MHHFTLAHLAVPLISYWFVAACGADATETAPASKKIGASGGVVTITTGPAIGASVSVPANALTSDVVISAAAHASPGPLPTAFEAVGPAVVFGPEGQTFNADVTVTLPATGPAIAMLSRPLLGGDWAEVVGARYDSSNRVVIARTRHFSVFVAVSTPSGNDQDVTDASNGDGEGDADSSTNPVSGETEVEGDSASTDSEIGDAQDGPKCPNTQIVVQEGQRVGPQTRLQLIGSGSTAAVGEITGYRWEADQPEGSQSRFFPSSSVADPTFEVNVVGRYAFRLTVTDSLGDPSCLPAEYDVFVESISDVHVELLWETPADFSTDDDVGADLDLHLTHPRATGGYDGDGDGVEDGWFDDRFDCNWANRAPDWGAETSIDDNPSLDRDDVDGVGPENLSFNHPEQGAEYKIGVHYYKASGFGISKATVRVYLYGELALEVEGVELSERDMWTVAHIAWPPNPASLAVRRVCSAGSTPCESNADCAGQSCVLQILPDYAHPSIFTPE